MWGRTCSKGLVCTSLFSHSASAGEGGQPGNLLSHAAAQGLGSRAFTHCWQDTCTAMGRLTARPGCYLILRASGRCMRELALGSLALGQILSPKGSELRAQGDRGVLRHSPCC